MDTGRPGTSKPYSTSAFNLDPEIKQEYIWHGATLRPSTTLVDRHGPIVRIRSENNGWNIVADSLAAFDSMMMHVADPRNAPELLLLRESIRAWRFYDHFRTDADAPARFPQIGTRTPVLGNDGSDLAAAIETIQEIGDSNALIQRSPMLFTATGSQLQIIQGGLRSLWNSAGCSDRWMQPSFLTERYPMCFG